jgi:hypothetical protein
VEPLGQPCKQHRRWQPTCIVEQFDNHGLLGRADQHEDFSFVLRAKVSEESFAPARIASDLTPEAPNQFSQSLSR